MLQEGRKRANKNNNNTTINTADPITKQERMRIMTAHWCIPRSEQQLQQQRRRRRWQQENSSLLRSSSRVSRRRRSRRSGTSLGIRSSSFPVLLLLFLGTIISYTTAQTIFRPYGYQALDTASSYGGALVYDRVNHRVVLSGQTYGNLRPGVDSGSSDEVSGNCFVAALQLPEVSEDVPANGGGKNKDIPTSTELLATDPKLLFTSTFGEPGVIETCVGGLALGDTNDKVYVGGWSEANGVLQSLLQSGNKRPPQFGIILDIDLAITVQGGESVSAETVLRGGELIRNTEGAQSAEFLALSDDGEYLYVVSWETEVGTEDQTICRDAVGTECNFSTGGDIKRGSNYQVNVIRYKTKPNAGSPTATAPALAQTLEPTWDRQIATKFEVEPTGFLIQGEDLVLVGNAIGSNHAIPSTAQSDDSKYDGFITQLEINTGAIVRGKRIESTIPGRATYVNDVCSHQEHLFIVGTTFGTVIPASEIDGSIDTVNPEEDERAFLMRLDPNDLSLEWVMEINATPPFQGGSELSDDIPSDIEGLRCSVTNDGIHVYVGGIVLNEATIGNGHVSKGADDVWMAQLMVEDDAAAANGSKIREARWIRQIGTSGDEFLVDLETDQYGNPLLLMNTDGSYLEESAFDGSTDILFLAMSRSTGDFPTPIEDTQVPITSTEPPVMVGPEDELDGDTAGDDSGSNSAGGDVSESEAPASPGGGDGVSRAAIAFLLIMILTVILVLGLFAYGKWRNDKEDYPDSSQVLEYLKGFENVEVDLKHSATGGWHGTYVNHDGSTKYLSSTTSSLNDVASGRPSFSDLSFHNEMEPFVQDSLFADDDDDVPQLGGLGGGSLGGGGGGGAGAGGVGGPSRTVERQGSTYGGLVDAYNTTWDELSPHNLPSRHTSSPKATPQRRLSPTPPLTSSSGGGMMHSSSTRHSSFIHRGGGVVVGFEGTPLGAMQEVDIEDDAVVETNNGTSMMNGADKRRSWGREII